MAQQCTLNPPMACNNRDHLAATWPHILFSTPPGVVSWCDAPFPFCLDPPLASAMTAHFTCYFGSPVPGIRKETAMTLGFDLSLHAGRIKTISRPAIQFWGQN